MRAGFTLIELLVVVAIISVLAAILLPSLTKARDRARTTLCLNNEKQLLLALLSYSQEWNWGVSGDANGTSYWDRDLGALINPSWVSNDRWQDPELGPRVSLDNCNMAFTSRTSFWCPSTDITLARTSSNPDRSRSSYTYNIHTAAPVHGSPGGSSWAYGKMGIESLPTPENTASFACYGLNGHRWLFFGSKFTRSDITAPTHNSQTTIGFADGHAAQVEVDLSKLEDGTYSTPHGYAFDRSIIVDPLKVLPSNNRFLYDPP